MDRYVLVTAARNEEAYIEKTLQAVVCQTVLPAKWIVVSDGSTDGTDEIVRRYARSHTFLELVRIEEDNKRNFRSQVDAINTGFHHLAQLDFGFIGNLDADISFDSDYYENILGEFRQEPKLGLAGGFIYEEVRGVFRSRKFNSADSVAHAVQLFRRSCIEDVGGYMALPYGGPDWVAEVTARMKGWKVRSLPYVKVYHHRPTASAGGVLRNRFEQGRRACSVGSHPLFELIKGLRRMTEKPYLVGGTLKLCGFLWGLLRNEDRMVSAEFVKYLRKEQMGRLRNLILRGKKSASVD